jgi:hypothetical protein
MNNKNTSCASAYYEGKKIEKRYTHSTARNDIGMSGQLHVPAGLLI